jgi:hypothetical protein
MARINARKIVFATNFSTTSGITAVVASAIALHIHSQYQECFQYHHHYQYLYYHHYCDYLLPILLVLLQETACL